MNLNFKFQVTLQRGAQSDDSCVKCSASPSSSEYNAPVRESLNICDVLPPPPDHPYYKPPNMSSMTIRTNPVAMSPQICRRQGVGQRWPTLPPPVPHFPQNWQQQQQQQLQQPDDQSYKRNRNQSPEIEEENDYESGSVLYEECDPNLGKNFFNYGGEPTEEYYRNINMEFLDENELCEPPPPCPDSLPKTNRTKHSGSGQSWLSQTHNPSESSASYDEDRHKPRNDQSHDHQSPVNSRRSARNQSCGSNQSSDESESDIDNNRWPSRLRRSRSKSSDRKYRNGR